VLLAKTDIADRIMDAISDHPWPYEWCRFEILGVNVTVMSSAIISMLLTALVLVGVIIPIAQRHKYLPRGSANVLEVLVLFVRDMIARPALHERAYDFLPFLLTLFVYVFGLNLMGVVPLEAISHATGLPLIGHTATSIPAVCGALASLTLLSIVFSGLARQTAECRARRGWPTWLCASISPVLWFRSLSPDVPGPTGKLLAVPLALMDLVGVVCRCFSLMIRLCANMLSGHMVLAILMVFVYQGIRAWWEVQATHLLYVGPLVVLGSVAIDLLELLVAGLQAYIFTFLTAVFVSLYSQKSH